MSTELGIALCALIGVVALVFECGTLEIKVTDLESEVKLLHSLKDSQQKYIESQRKYIDSLSKRIDQNAYSIRQLSESCGQIDDLDTEIKVNQKRVERTLDMIEELKAKRSMDVLDKLREDDKK